MAVSRAFAVQRIALIAGALTPVYPPRTAADVTIGNATSGDLQVFTAEDGESYLVVEAGFERPITVARQLFTEREIAFWLQAAVDGTAVLIWT